MGEDEGQVNRSNFINNKIPLVKFHRKIQLETFKEIKTLSTVYDNDEWDVCAPVKNEISNQTLSAQAKKASNVTESMMKKVGNLNINVQDSKYNERSEWYNDLWALSGFNNVYTINDKK